MGTQLARPTVLTPQRQVKILEYIKAGNYIVTACEAAGITTQIFYHWRKRWELGDSNAQAFDDFFSAIKIAASIAEAESLKDLKKGEPGWQAKAWFLERRFPKRWGKQDRAETQMRDMSKASDEELANIAKGKGGC